MSYLIIVSVIWAFSFGLIKTYLIGNLAGIDPTFVAWARLTIALPVFLPFLRLKRIDRTLAIRLFFIGAVQYGLMYISYLQAYRYLDAYQVALFTIFTPIYVTLIHDLQKRRFRPIHLAAAAVAVGGAAVIQYRGIALSGAAAGFIFMQISNICFAYGQVEYKRIRPSFSRLPDRSVYALLYLGAVAVTAVAVTLNGSWSSLGRLNAEASVTLLYLGVLASGLCFFWWNKGAVRTGGGTLAVFNNLKIPLAVAISLLVFGEETDPAALLLGGGIMLGAVWLSQIKK